jgi:hypothetical protein
MANIHPFFSGIDVNSAANWTLQFLTDHVISTTTNLSPKPEIIISEGQSPQFLAEFSRVAVWWGVCKFISCGNKRNAIFPKYVSN